MLLITFCAMCQKKLFCMTECFVMLYDMRINKCCLLSLFYSSVWFVVYLFSLVSAVYFIYFILLYQITLYIFYVRNLVLYAGFYIIS